MKPATPYTRDPVGFIDQYLPLNEKGKPWKLSRHQRRVLAAAFRWDEQGRLRVRTFVWGEMKKSGKTFLAACLALWWAFTNSSTEVIIAANDLEQSVGRVFQTIVQLLSHNSELSSSAAVRAKDIVLTNGTSITAIASDYKGAAGSRHSLVVFDELWGYSLEAAQRLYEELTPPPTEENAWVLVVTYAGWSGESVLLERLYKQGLAGERIDAELELYRADELTMFWSHTPRQPWQTERYYAEQRRSLRPGTFARLHRNEWVTAESAFIPAELYDACVDRAHRPALPDKGIELFIGIDGSTKHDTAAVVAVSRQGSRLYLVAHRIWHPSPLQPLDLEVTIEAFLLDLDRDFTVRLGFADPFQLHRSIMTVQAAGVPITDFPQTVGNTVRMGQALYDVFKGGNLILYPDHELRSQVLNAVAVETPRGFRIAKEKASKKIDGCVALSMAVCAALDQPVSGPLFFFSEGRRIGSDLITAVNHGIQSVVQSVSAALTSTGKAITAPVHTLIDQEPQCYRHPAGRKRTIEEIAALSEGVRSPAEQRRLDKHYARPHADSPFEVMVRQSGVYFPDSDGPPPIYADWREAIAAKFQRWR